MFNDELKAKRDQFLAKSSQDRTVLINFLKAVIADLQSKYGIRANISMEPPYRATAMQDLVAEIGFDELNCALRVDFQERPDLQVQLAADPRWTPITQVGAFTEVLREKLATIYG